MILATGRKQYDVDTSVLIALNFGNIKPKGHTHLVKDGETIEVTTDIPIMVLLAAKGGQETYTVIENDGYEDIRYSMTVEFTPETEEVLVKIEPLTKAISSRSKR